ncbi:MAG: YCF48-related protein [Candidatus Uhrbacteria bacterium]|nr:YCF48-related protein [Candidatus Uhrbacteria bacterium]
MKNLFLSFVFLVFAFSAHSVFAADWTLLSSGVAQSFRAVSQSGTNIVAAGSGGRIFYSADNGKTWTKSFEAQGITFFDFTTMPNGDLLVAGSDGINEVSSNHGVTWSVYSFGVTKNIYGIDVKTVNGSSTGYLVGATGTYKNFIRNSGNWDTHNLDITSDLFGVEDEGGGTGWIVGADGKIFKLIYGGESWGEIQSGTRETLYAIKFVSATKGFIVGTMGTILKTTDSGSTWKPVSVSGLANQALYSLDVSGDLMVIAGDKILMDSGDAGETWHVKTFDGTNKKFYGALVKDASHIFAVGSDDDSVSLVYQLTEPVVVTPPVVVETPLPQGAAAQSSLIKLPCLSGAGVNDICKAVYYYATDGKRHAFPNDKVYFSWFTDFSTVKEVSADFLSSLTLGKNVTYRPGVKMVKFQTSPQVYVVAKGGTLRAVLSESIAAALYGSDWNKKIDDISDVFYGNYKFGEPVVNASDYDPAQTRILVGSISENF